MWLKQFCAITAATLLLLLPAPVLAASSATTYTMTEAEMQALDSRLMQLLSQIKVSNKALNESQAALTQSQTELSRLKAESLALQQQMQEQSSLLESANKSLQKFAQEEKRVKKQRLLWQIIAGSVVVVLAKEKL